MFWGEGRQVRGLMHVLGRREAGKRANACSGEKGDRKED